MDWLLVLPHGIEATPFLEPSLEDRQEANRIRHLYPAPLWLACGRLTYYKGLIHAVRALPHVPGTLLIIGDGPEKARLEAEVARLGLDRRVGFFCRAPRAGPPLPPALSVCFPSGTP